MRVLLAAAILIGGVLAAGCLPRPRHMATAPAPPAEVPSPAPAPAAPDASGALGMQAEVLAVNNKVNLVMLSVGSGDGVKKGCVFTIYRGVTYVGRATVEQVFADMCSARIDASSRAADAREGDDARAPGLPQRRRPAGRITPTGAIRVGDNAATRVY